MQTSRQPSTRPRPSRRGRRAAARGAVLGIVIAAAAATPSFAAASDGLDDHGQPVVQTTSGRVRGSATDNGERFLGIPFAAAPVGDLRFAPPAPAPRWTGVRAATSYGPACPQLPSGNGPRSESEDCLHLNVFRPRTTGIGRHGPLPVLFNIYGGGLQNGGAQQYDGSKLAADNDIVVVTANYRLNVFGLLALPGLTADSPKHESGDQSLLDQQAALRWTRANIAAFGGDPAAVTIAGESAGAFSVCAHLVAPGSAGLFRAGILQSGGCPSTPLAQAETSGSTFAASVGCPDQARAPECLRRLPVATLLDASASTFYGFVSGGPTLPVPPADAVTAGHFARVPVIVGSTHDEGRTFALGMTGYTAAQYQSWVQTTFGTDATAVLARYPLSNDAGPFAPVYAIAAIITDAGLVSGIGGCSSLHLTERLSTSTPTYAYQFDDRTFPGLTPGKPPGYVWGAPHAGDLPYLFPSFDNGTPIYPLFTPAQRRLADDMSRYWGAFTRYTRPNASGSGLTAWQPFRDDAILSLRPGGASTRLSTATYRAQHQCDLWDRIGGTRRT